MKVILSINRTTKGWSLSDILVISKNLHSISWHKASSKKLTVLINGCPRILSSALFVSCRMCERNRVIFGGKRENGARGCGVGYEVWGMGYKKKTIFWRFSLSR